MPCAPMIWASKCRKWRKLRVILMELYIGSGKGDLVKVGNMFCYFKCNTVMVSVINPGDQALKSLLKCRGNNKYIAIIPSDIYTDRQHEVLSTDMRNKTLCRYNSSVVLWRDGARSSRGSIFSSQSLAIKVSTNVTPQNAVGVPTIVFGASQRSRSSMR